MRRHKKWKAFGGDWEEDETLRAAEVVGPYGMAGGGDEPAPKRAIA